MALALVVVGAGACTDDAGSGSGADPAATVDGEAISADELVDELDAIAGNDAYLAAYEEASAAQGGSAILAGDRDGEEFDTAFVRETLSVRIQYTIVAAEVDRREIEGSDECTAEAEAVLVERFTVPGGELDGEAMLAGFDEAYRAYLVDRQADVLALQADLNGTTCGGGVTDEAVEAYFEANEEALTAEVACVSHILVDTEEEADEVVALLAGGADFAALATERSTDPGSGAAGGELGCGPAGRYVPEFDDAAFSQPVGEVGEPVETEFGFHVILVTERSAPTLEELRPQIEAALEQEAGAAFQAWFEEALATTEVTVDPRYGTWDPLSAQISEPAPTGPVIVDSGDG